MITVYKRFSNIIFIVIFFHSGLASAEEPKCKLEIPQDKLEYLKSKSEWAWPLFESVIRLLEFDPRPENLTADFINEKIKGICTISNLTREIDSSENPKCYIEQGSPAIVETNFIKADITCGKYALLKNILIRNSDPTMSPDARFMKIIFYGESDKELAWLVLHENISKSTLTIEYLSVALKDEKSNEFMRLLFNSIFNENGEIFQKEFMINPSEPDLKEVYAVDVLKNIGSDMTLEKIQETAKPKKEDVIVALISPGVDYLNPDISWKLARSKDSSMLGLDLEENDNLPFPYGWVFFLHTYINFSSGTAMAKIIINDSDKIKLLPIRLNPFDSSKDKIEKAIEFAKSNGASIIYMDGSSGVGEYTEYTFNHEKQLLEAEVHKEEENEASLEFESQIKNNPEILFVFPVGGFIGYLYPQAYANKYPNVINVTTADTTGSLFGHSDPSSLGNKSNWSYRDDFDVHVAITKNDGADSDDVLSSKVSNIAAKIKALDKEFFTPALIKQVIMDTVDPKEGLKNKIQSGGVVNEEKALERAKKLLAESKK